nr:MAG TPA: hypothetical protein [Caudoviricetes sp.]
MTGSQPVKALCLITYCSKTPTMYPGQSLGTRRFGGLHFYPSPTEKPVRNLCAD